MAALDDGRCRGRVARSIGPVVGADGRDVAFPHAEWMKDVVRRLGFGWSPTEENQVADVETGGEP